MKSTMLAAAAQLAISREDRVAGPPLLTACQASTATGYRAAPIAQHGQRRTSPSARAPRVSSIVPAQHLHPMDLHTGPWVKFTSRHELLHSTAQPSEPQPELPKCILTDSDREAEAVEQSAKTHVCSDSKDEAAPASPRHIPPSEQQLYICNGPWSALHLPTPESLEEYGPLPSPLVLLVHHAPTCVLNELALGCCQVFLICTTITAVLVPLLHNPYN